jgi:hypothetical protein
MEWRCKRRVGVREGVKEAKRDVLSHKHSIFFFLWLLCLQYFEPSEIWVRTNVMVPEL